jgi:Uma2 family endonuclease
MVADLKQRRYTLEEYLELDRQSEARLEFHDGEIFNMSGASAEHNEIESNIHFNLRTKLEGRNCRLFLANMRIKVPGAPPYRYGDFSALCGESEFVKIGGVDTLVNPSLIVEVLSPSTEKYDRAAKFKQYGSIASLVEYMLVNQDVAFVAQYIRRGDEWIYRSFMELTDVVKLESLDCEITLDEIYRNVAFDKTSDEEAYNLA